MQKKNRKAIIIFPDPWLSYSPTVINASRMLSSHLEVSILTVGKDQFVSNTFNDYDNITLKFIDSSNSTLIRIIRKFDWISNLFFARILKIRWLNSSWNNEVFIGNNLENCRNYFKFKKELKGLYREGDLIIGVDNVGMLVASAYRSGYYGLSLEIGKNIFYYFIKWSRLLALIIQSPERSKYYLSKKSSAIKTYYIQNAPFLNPLIQGLEQQNNFKLVYLGSLAIEYNALQKIADAMMILPDCYSIVLKGPSNPGTELFFTKNYPSLINNKRMIFDFRYISNDELAAYLSNFSIGITLYNIDSLPYKNFNVISCPSGKLFNYYNSGLPVVGNNIIGLNSITEMNAGIQVTALSGQGIADAVLAISSNYPKYAANAKNAAIYFDFEKGMSHFIKSELGLAG